MTPTTPPTYERPELFLLEPDGSRSSVLPAALTPRGTQRAAWCRSCDKLHYHSAEAGHRVAHCFVDDSP
jgi:hypothetical protein